MALIQSTHVDTAFPTPVTTASPVRRSGSRARALSTLEQGDVERAQGRDREAFERVYRQRIGPVSRYIAAIVRDTTRVEDVTAQTFLLAWRDLPKLRQTERFDAWLFRIAHNQAVSEVTRRRPTTPLENTPEPADDGRFGAPEREFDRAVEAQELHRAIAELPATQREVLQLRYFSEMSSAEIARQVGKNEQSVWALTHRALKNLKRSMGA